MISGEFRIRELGIIAFVGYKLYPASWASMNYTGSFLPATGRVTVAEGQADWPKTNTK